MENVSIPEGYQTVMPYMIMENAAGFLAFVKKVFSATEKMMVMREDDKIMHAEIRIGDSTIMFAETTHQWHQKTAGLFIYVADADETYAKALAEGAKSVTKMANQEYGRSGGVEDPFGNVWWITSPIA